MPMTVELRLLSAFKKRLTTIACAAEAAQAREKRSWVSMLKPATMAMAPDSVKRIERHFCLQPATCEVKP
jgi:hypothetical protein